MENYISSHTAATLLRVDQRTVQRWCADGLLSGAYLIRRSRRLGWQIPITSVYALLEEEEHAKLVDGVPA